MLQDIYPHQFRNEYENKAPNDSDFVFVFKSGYILLKKIKSDPVFEIPRFESFKNNPEIKKDALYLFSIDGAAYFLAGTEPSDEITEEKNTTEEVGYYSVRSSLNFEQGTLAFACVTAFHLAKWYDSRRFCGRCGKKTVHKEDERAVYCKKCHQTEYPKISPVVIVGIKNGDEILLTKYTTAASEYRNYALIAGFVEIGETLEEAIQREVLEEVGVHVKNMTYYKSQPWAMSESLLMGFFADLDGDKSVRLEVRELSEAVWISRKEIPEGDSTMSLTWEMIEAFRSGKIE
ncbi:NADH pyrophosphatase [Methanimicrococcus sp. At1]|uniref:NAD(+) diphosphatase n=1 Tax=Methanimicrococcus hacksteinii TaxID=3028293 RepID=A0ABU3VQY2_9EURY|nr:NAD(+) diphosphatase [Methanimicrococcus sp. At1]MDV0445808.1 NADH pyrophosphatase [Methanimicrococcus sp. At1]